MLNCNLQTDYSNYIEEINAEAIRNLSPVTLTMLNNALPCAENSCFVLTVLIL